MSNDRFTASQARRPVVLILNAFYLPGFRGGGPIRTIENLRVCLGNEFDFWIVTSDRDLMDRCAYPGVRVNVWQEFNNARIIYLSPGPLRLWRIARLLRLSDFNLLHINSLLSRAYAMWPLLLWVLRLTRPVSLLISPRSELSAGCLSIKTKRKRIYLRLLRLMLVFRKPLWNASTEYENLDIVNSFWPKAHILVAPPIFLPEVPVCGKVNSSCSSEPLSSRTKSVGALEVIFISRISKKKNLDLALRIIARVSGEVHFSIYGSKEDLGLWDECERLINKLPPNVKAEYRGELTHDLVLAEFERHHLFLFPTLSENFGHVMIEAFSCGCLVLTSDQTPWRQLKQQGIGWDLPLVQFEAFCQAIQECIDMDNQAFQEHSTRARLYSKSCSYVSGAVGQNRSMLLNAMHYGQS